MIDAIVLAGAPNTGALKEISDAQNEALIEVNGRPMVDYVVRALADSGVIGRIVVVGPPELLRNAVTSASVEYVKDEGTMIGNLMAGANRLSASEKACVVTSDIPLLTGEGIRDFVERCESVKADLYYSVVERRIADERFPGVQRTYVKLVDGEYTGGNVCILAPQKLIESIDLLNQAVALRKKPFQLARMLGLGFIIKFVAKKLSIKDIEARVEKMIGMKGRAVVSPYPEVGVDVDKPSDLELVRRNLTW